MSGGIIVHRSLLLRGNEMLELCPISTGQTIVCQMGYMPDDVQLAAFKKAIAETEKYSPAEREEINKSWLEHQRIERDKQHAELRACLGNEKPKRMSGKIYIMRNERNGMVKIGISKSPKVRERTLQSQEPEITMVYCSQSTYSWDDERAIHAHFLPKRVRGEWFSLSEEEISSVKWMAP
jgi:hypothetical protein